ncbi:aminopeptidase P family protein [Pelagibius litoralis]|uniref:Aminopeptidase P family protein n=1 Tax=Pelagibius litoralis TaxID=374515 RepID=A0A967CBW8_9PROT|nr:aminopeptidase P family protein [Pelagibius litoralis]NIA68653.1 aminopeptidase P family protein [Pelagibius litoralis]
MGSPDSGNISPSEAGETADHGARLAALRAELARREVQGFLIPRADEHQGEYVPASAQRLEWLTGFSGSAGTAAVLPETAAVFIDGRYTLQVRNEVDVDLFTPRHLTEEPLSAWLAEGLKPGQRLAYDPWLHTEDQVRRLEKTLAAAEAEAVALSDNPLDAVWHDRPAVPQAEIRAHDLSYAGRESADKREGLGKALTKQGVAAAVITLPDSIAWLLNVRGGDVERSPLPLSFSVLHADGAVEWFVDAAKVSDGLAQHLGNAVSIQAPQRLGEALDRLGVQGAKVLADPATAARWIFDRLRAAGAAIEQGADPCQLPKACKNETELAGTRAAHKRDGAALSRFLHWLDSAVAQGQAVTEMAAADRLAAFRGEAGDLRDLSFDTIAGSGPNGAIVHYRVSPQSDRQLAQGELFLCDSGAQYPDGTTDVTRTVAIGTPDKEMCARFTLVLKGHIALGAARFPEGTSGSQLDSLARYALWQNGLDYDHGTGHGVGSYLNVHEGPQRISKMPNSVALQPGMIVSNEPGYYKTGAYGIRIENLVAVTESSRAAGEERAMLAFETLTLAPIDRRLIVPAMLTADEIDWVDAYHARVRAEIGPQLDGEARVWLEQATAPLQAG